MGTRQLACSVMIAFESFSNSIDSRLEERPRTLTFELVLLQPFQKQPMRIASLTYVATKFASRLWTAKNEEGLGKQVVTYEP